jgi:hypothetical protein
VSERQRRIIRRIEHDPGEVARLYGQMGKAIPVWLIKGRSATGGLSVQYRLATEFLDETAEKFAAIDSPQLEAALDTLRRACKAVELTYELPRNSPKHRDSIRALFAEAWAALEELESQGTIGEFR